MINEKQKYKTLTFKVFEILPALAMAVPNVDGAMAIELDSGTPIKRPSRTKVNSCDNILLQRQGLKANILF